MLSLQQKSTGVLICQFNNQLLRSPWTNFAKTQCPYLAFFYFPPSTAPDSRSILFEGQSLKPSKPLLFYFYFSFFFLTLFHLASCYAYWWWHSCSCTRKKKKKKAAEIWLLMFIKFAYLCKNWTLYGIFCVMGLFGLGIMDEIGVWW